LVVPSDARGAIKIPDAGPVGRIARDLLARPEDPRSFEDWANEIGVSTSTLARRFKVDTGVSFGQWRVLLRMNVAMSLLGQGAAVADVAERIGYSTPSSFVAAFKQSTGVTPMVFRKNADR
ncbi:MAG: AraC family transcriptional regulator, partial [Rhodococcus sp. (in: high G+C Gram-positive bacteria)]